MSKNYKVGDVADLFDVSRETIRRWASEFEIFLSTNANPDTGLTRYFTVSDVEVFDLVNEVKDSGGTYEDARLRLQGGERGAFPQKPLDRTEQTMVLSQMSQQLKQTMQERDALKRKLEELDEEMTLSREEISRLKGIIEEKEKSSGNSGHDLETARKRIEELLMKVAVLEYQLKQDD